MLLTRSPLGKPAMATGVDLLQPFPRHGITFKVFVSKVEQEVSQLLRRRIGNGLPLSVEFVETQVARNLIKLTPFGRNSAEAALTAIPTLIIDVANCVSPNTIET